MGRYWTTQNSSGKFGFACQSSSDPEYFNMAPVSVGYGLSDTPSNRTYINKRLDQQYDLLGVPVEKRKYELESAEEIDKFLEEMELYTYEVVEIGKKKNLDCFYLSDTEAQRRGYSNAQGLTLIEKCAGANLALCRIKLGLDIMLDLLLDGGCALMAEL